MTRLFILFLTIVVLWAGVGQLNYALSGAHLHFFAGGLFVAYAALALPRSEGLTIAILGGAVCDAHAPVAFGTHVLLFAAAATLIHALRERLPHDHVLGRVSVALTANAALFVALSLLEAHGAARGVRLWPRLVPDLVFSEILVALVAPWFFSLQEKALALAPAEPQGMF